MAYFGDLTPYSYWPRGFVPGTLNVGWHDKEHGFEEGGVPAGFIDRLGRFCTCPVMQTRGLHCCEFCPGNSLEMKYPWLFPELNEHRLGSAEIRVFGSDGTIYAAPDLIYHYVKDHSYLPPQKFVDAVMNCPCPEDPEFFRLLKGIGLFDEVLYKINKETLKNAPIKETIKELEKDLPRRLRDQS
jgi:hypothetical protein